jgi:hypothetical protein
MIQVWLSLNLPYVKVLSLMILSIWFNQTACYFLSLSNKYVPISYTCNLHANINFLLPIHYAPWTWGTEAIQGMP